MLAKFGLNLASFAGEMTAVFRPSAQRAWATNGFNGFLSPSASAPRWAETSFLRERNLNVENKLIR